MYKYTEYTYVYIYICHTKSLLESSGCRTRALDVDLGSPIRDFVCTLKKKKIAVARYTVTGSWVNVNWVARYSEYRVAKTRRIPCLYRSFSLYLVALLWKMMCILGDLMSLRHPVVVCWSAARCRVDITCPTYDF